MLVKNTLPSYSSECYSSEWKKPCVWIKLPHFPQSTSQFSSTKELKRKHATFRNTPLGLPKILVHVPSHRNNSQTHPFFNSQLGMILQFRGCITELVHRNVDSTASTVFWQGPAVAAQTDHASNLETVKAAKMPREATPQPSYSSCSDLARDSSSVSSDLCWMTCSPPFRQKAPWNLEF